VTLPGRQFETSRKIPEEVFASGTPRIVADLLDADLVGHHMGTVALGIRNVLCVPLRLVRYLDRGEAAGEEQRIGVLYLDSREKGALLANSTRTALETLATEAAVAIENARLYRETVEKARLEQEMRIAAEIQLALLPKEQHTGRRFTVCATTIPSRSIGGDFFDYLGLPGGRFHFVLGDVTGKGPPAALLSAMVLGIFAAQDGGATQPADTVGRVNDSLCRRAIESKFVTAVYGHLGEDGTLVYANAGHNPPLVVGGGGVRRLEAGGTPLGMFEGMPYQQESLTLAPGDVLVVFSDGVSEALSVADEEYGEHRIAEVVSKHLGAGPRTVLDALIRDVKTFAEGAPQNDDITALVLSFHG
jgi:sigma-B regulation protein RsbU (phosphoserine phosphatase)